MRKFKIKFQNLSFNPMQNTILERNKGFNSKKVVFFTFLNCVFPESNETKFWSHRLWANCKKWTKRWFELLLQSAIMFKMVILMLSWYLHGIFLIGPIHQHKTLHLRDGFSLVCYLLINKRYLRTICYVPKLL